MPFGFNLPFGKKKEDDDLLKDLENLDTDKNTESTSKSFSNLALQSPTVNPSLSSSANNPSSVSNTSFGFMSSGQAPVGFSGTQLQSANSQQGQMSQDIVQQRINQILDQIQSQNIKYEQLKVEFGTISINLEIIKRQLEQIKLKIDNPPTKQ